MESLKALAAGAAESGGRKKRGGTAIGAGVAPQVLVAWIGKATAALEGARARRFVHQLLTWPGVEGAIEEAGGWQTTEGLAGLVLRHRFEDEVQLSMLQDVTALAELVSSPLESEPEPEKLEEIKAALAELRKRHVAPDGEMLAARRKRGGKRGGKKGAAEQASPSQEEQDELAMYMALADEPESFPSIVEPPEEEEYWSGEE